MSLVYNFSSFVSSLYEYTPGGETNSMIIGDSLVPSIYQNITPEAKRHFLYEKPDVGLNHSGWAVFQLNKALESAPVREEIRNVFISIGSNEVYTEIPASPLKRLAQNLKTKFPNARYYTFRGEKGYATAVDGGSDWFNKKIPNIDNAIESYYSKFPPLGINVLSTPSIYSTKHPGASTPGIQAVAKEISKIVEGGAPSKGSSIASTGSSGSDNIIIGDSQTPFIAKRSKNIRMLSSKGSKQALWLGGMGLDWLKGAVADYQVSPNVANVVINIGTNGGFNSKEDIGGLFKELRRVFPKANFFVVQGSWGWGGNKSVTQEKVKTYYSKFADQGATIIDPPIGSVSDPHGNLPIYSQIGKSIDSVITNSPARSSEVPSGSSQSSDQAGDRPGNVENFQDWLDSNKPGWAWGYPNGVVNRKGGYGRFGPRTSKAWSQYRDEYLKNKDKRSSGYAENDLVNNSGILPEKTDTEISKQFNFHLIPDGLGTNYRSAQLTPDVMKRIYKKYGIKNVIRFNGDGKDAKHHPEDPEVSIREEESICKDLGCTFYKLSATRDQEKVNNILSKGNTLIHCAHGADRTGGNVGGYFYDRKINPKLLTPEQIWAYTTQYNSWNNMSLKRPEAFQDGYLQQAQKFGVKNLEQAQALAKNVKKLDYSIEPRSKENLQTKEVSSGIKEAASDCTIWIPKNVTGPVDVFIFYPGIKVGDSIGKVYMPPLIESAVSDWFRKYVIIIPNKHTTPFSDVRSEMETALAKNKLTKKSLSIGIFSGSGNDTADITKYLGDLNIKNLILMDPTPGSNLISAVKKLTGKGTGIYLMYNPSNWGEASYYGGVKRGSLYGPISKLVGEIPNSDRVSTGHMKIPTEILKKYRTQLERNLL